MRLVSRYSRLCRTNAGCRWMRSRGCIQEARVSLLESELRQRTGVVGPVFAHLDPEIQMQAAPKTRIEFLARLLPDALQARTPGADDDGFLPRPIDPDDGVDHELFARFLELLDFDGDAIGKLFDELHGELFADGLGDLEFDTAVGALVGREQFRRFGQSPSDHLDEPLDIAALLRRYRNDIEERMARRELGRERQEFVLLRDLVDLVDDGDGVATGVLDTPEHRLVFFAEA